MLTRELNSLLDGLRADGVRLWVQDGRLRYAPTDALDATRLATLREHRAQVVALLAAPDGPAPLVAGPRPATLPLSAAQESVWVLSKFEEGSSYNVSTAVRINGALDVAALSGSVAALVRRHEILRTRFEDVDGVGTQVVSTDDVPRLEVVDLTAESRDTVARHAGELVREHGDTVFDLARRCPLGVRLIALAEDEHVLVITAHHILFDGPSLDIVFTELVALYDAGLRGEPSPLPALPAQYADYAVWERARPAGELAADIAYWRQRLSGVPALDLPADHTRPAVPDFAGDAVSFTLPRKLSQALAAVAKRYDATPFMVLLACYQAMLCQWTGQSDLAVGVPVDGRAHPDADGMIGHFSNTVVVRATLGARPTFADVLRQVRPVVIEAYEHRHLPIDRVVAELSTDRAATRQALFQVMFSFLAQQQDSFGTLGLEYLDQATRTAKLDLSLFVADTPDGFAGTLEYATSLFERTSVQRLADHFTRLAEAMAADPEQPIHRVPLMSRAEHQRVVLDWNATDRAVPGDSCVHELVGQQAARTPDATAVVCQGTTLTYGELNARANQVAHRLRAEGVGPESIVAVCAERSCELVIALLGVLKAGAAYLPLDPAYPRERLDYMVADSGARLALVQPGLLPGLTGPVRIPVNDPAQWAGLPTTDPEPLAEPDNLAYILYTSGSTGRPKGVASPHRGIVNRLRWMRAALGLGPDDAVLQKTLTGFDVSVWEIFGPLISGARMVLAPPTRYLEPAHLCRLINEHRVTMVHFVPAMLAGFLASPDIEPCPSLRWVLSSGEELPAPLVDRFFRWSDCDLYNLYGPTEAAIEVTAWRCAPGEPGSVPIGRPFWNNRIYVLDERFQPVPPGRAGHLYLAGDQLARGYLNRPDLTAQRFIAGPYGPPGSRMYDTGDLARWRPDGVLEFLGRVDDQVKIRGFRIEPGEIETAITAHPAVARAAVVVREDTPGDRRLVAYLVPDGTHAAQVLRWARADRSGELTDLDGHPLPDGTLVLAPPGERAPEAEHRRLVESGVFTGLPDDPVVFDVDAGIGLCSLLAGRFRPAARVFVTERDPDASRALVANLDVHGLTATPLVGDGLSAALTESDVDRVDLLNLGAHCPVADVLRAVEIAHWPLLRQVVLHRTDWDEQLGDAVELLRDKGFHVTVARAADSVLVRATRGPRVGDASSPPAPAGWCDPERLVDEVRAKLRTDIPDFMLPSAFVLLDELPVTPNGKLDKRALPAPGSGRAGVPFVAPRTEREAGVADIWREVLGVERIGVHESFFEAGGHSMLALQVIARIKKNLGVEVALRDFYASPTVAGLVSTVVEPTEPEDRLAGVL